MTTRNYDYDGILRTLERTSDWFETLDNNGQLLPADYTANRLRDAAEIVRERREYVNALQNDLLERLLDDADELARLREGIRCEIAVFQQYDLTDEANRLTQLLNNGDGDGDES